MRKFARGVLLTFLLLCASGYFFTLPGAITKTKAEILYNVLFTLDTLTIYNPSRTQCDADPFITASNKKIDLTRLRNGSIRWMALSRDLLKRWGGALHYGDTITLQTGDLSVDGTWVIQDTMNKRFKNRGDLLFDAASRSHGMWTNAKILKRKIYYTEVRKD